MSFHDGKAYYTLSYGNMDDVNMSEQAGKLKWNEMNRLKLLFDR